MRNTLMVLLPIFVVIQPPWNAKAWSAADVPNIRTSIHAGRRVPLGVICWAQAITTTASRHEYGRGEIPARHATIDGKDVIIRPGRLPSDRSQRGSTLARPGTAQRLELAARRQVQQHLGADSQSQSKTIACGHF